MSQNGVAWNALIVGILFFSGMVAGTDDKKGGGGEGGGGGGGGGWGNPAFNGSLFFFQGVPDGIFNIITTRDMKVTCRLVDAELPANSHLGQSLAMLDQTHGTFMSEIGMQFMNQFVTVRVNREGVLDAINVNGRPLDTTVSSNLFLAEDVEVDFQLFRPWYGQSVAILTPDFDILIYPTLAHEDEELFHVRGHLNFEVLAVHLMVDELEHVHGILGQTLSHQDKALASTDLAVPISHQMEAGLFSGDGEEADYQIGSLLGSDFRFNTFSGHHKIVSLARKILAFGGFGHK